jgi:hypothetical protein
MVKYKSRVNTSLGTIKNKPTKRMATKVANTNKSNLKPLAENIPNETGGAINPQVSRTTAKQAAVKKVAPVIKKVAPAVVKAVKKIKMSHVPNAGIPMFGGAFPEQADALDDETIDQLDPHVFTHMLGNMDMPTHNILKGIAANYLGVEHPMRLITKKALGGDFSFPKHLSKIALRDVMKANSPQQLAGALHSEVMDMNMGKLSREEMGGGLFASLKMLVKKGVKGSRKALKALGSGAKKAVEAVSKGAKGAQHIGKSVNNALLQGIQVANALEPIITEVFPASQGVLKEGIGKAKAASELVKRGVNISQRVGEVADDPAAAFARALGELSAPIVQDLPAAEPKAGALEEPHGVGLDLSNQSESGSEISGPRFIS